MSNRAPLVLTVAGAAAVLSGACSAPWSDSSHGPLTRSQAISRLEADGFTNVRPMVLNWTDCTPTDMGITNGGGPHVRRPSYGFMFKDPQAARGIRVGLLGVYMFSASDSAFTATCAKGGLFSALHHSTYVNGKSVPGKRISPNTVVVGAHAAGLPGLIPGTTGDYQTFLATGPVLAMGESGTRPGAARAEADLARAAGDLS